TSLKAPMPLKCAALDPCSRANARRPAIASSLVSKTSTNVAAPASACSRRACIATPPSHGPCGQNVAGAREASDGGAETPPGLLAERCGGESYARQLRDDIARPQVHPLGRAVLV